MVSHGWKHLCKAITGIVFVSAVFVVSTAEQIEHRASAASAGDANARPMIDPSGDDNIADHKDQPVDFDTQIVPIFTKAGCNAGACHGSAAGRGGFHLSLFGGRPEDDFAAIVQEFGGRRVNLADPSVSLILQKPTGSLEHGGNVRLDWDGAGHRLIQRWINEGAQRLQQRSLTKFRVVPATKVISKDNPTIQLAATAEFSDGTQQDVTSWTVFTAADPAAVQISNGAGEIDATSDAADIVQAHVQRPGQHTVIARYLDQVLPIELVMPVGDAPTAARWQSAENLVDRHVLKKLAQLRLQPSPGADDATFVRRVTLDLIGRLPTADDLAAFAAARKSQGSDVARAELVDRLLASAAFSDYWTYRLSKLLRIRSAPRDKQGAAAFARWLHDSIKTGRPLDEMVRELLLSTGDTHENGPANFYRVAADARLQAEYASELLMGARLRCANCHNHPLDRWTQDDYHGLAAIFAKVQTGQVIRTNPRGEVTHPATGEAARQRIPGGAAVVDGANGREEFANWLLAEDNAYFGRVWVNRLWKALMGRGLVEATDDLRATNPATHPELLDQLTADFVAHGYDLRQTLRLIATSDAYAASPAPPSVEAVSLRFYAYATPKPLEAEVLADAVSDVTGVWTAYADFPVGKRAITIYDGAVAVPTLDILGRCGRDESCESTDVATLRGLASKLHFLNGDWINTQLVDPGGRLQQMITQDPSDEAVVDAFYRSALSRTPTEAEKDYWLRTIKDAPPDERRSVLEDFVWALLNSQTFTHNY